MFFLYGKEMSEVCRLAGIPEPEGDAPLRDSIRSTLDAARERVGLRPVEGSDLIRSTIAETLATLRARATMQASL